MNQLPRDVLFFPVPQIFVRGGSLRNWRDCEIRLYVLLLHESERLSRPTIKLTNVEIARGAGLSPSSVRGARTKLCEYRAITTKRGAGGVYTYTLVDLRTGVAWPQRRRGSGGSTPVAHQPGKTSDDVP